MHYNASEHIGCIFYEPPPGALPYKFQPYQYGGDTKGVSPHRMPPECQPNVVKCHPNALHLIQSHGSIPSYRRVRTLYSQVVSVDVRSYESTGLGWARALGGRYISDTSPSAHRSVEPRMTSMLTTRSRSHHTSPLCSGVRTLS